MNRIGKRTIQMRPESIFEKPKPKTKLVPAYESPRNTKGVSMKSSQSKNLQVGFDNISNTNFGNP